MTWIHLLRPSRLVCALRGHQPLVYDRLPDGTPIRGCPRCGSYIRRETADPRPQVRNQDPRLRLSAREQHEARQSAVRALRGMRLRRERDSLRLVRSKGA